MAKIQKEFGPDAVFWVGERPDLVAIETFSSGIPTMDLASDHGGIPYGRTIELYGMESVGKTSLALFWIAVVQAAGYRAAFIDSERSFNAGLAERYGVDLSKLLLVKAPNGEKALDIANALVSSGEFRIIVIDSVASLTPEKETEISFSDQLVGTHARLMSKAMRVLTAPADDSKCAMVFINQIRIDVGKMYGNPETRPGGKALGFFTSIRIRLSRGNILKNAEDEATGHEVKFKFEKNKIGRPFREGSYYLMYGMGIDVTQQIQELVEATDGIIEKSGSRFILLDREGNPYPYDEMQPTDTEKEGVYRWNGKDNFIDAIRNHEWLKNYLVDRLKEVQETAKEQLQELKA